MKYFYSVGFGLVGCESTGVLEAKNLNEADEVAYGLAHDNANMFGYYEDPELSDCRDDVFSEGDPNDHGFIDYYVELYIPEVHDCQIA